MLQNLAVILLQFNYSKNSFIVWSQIALEFVVAVAMIPLNRQLLLESLHSAIDSKQSNKIPRK